MPHYGVALLGAPVGAPLGCPVGAPVERVEQTCNKKRDTPMAGVTKKAGRADWYAIWKVGRQNVRKSTRVKIVQAGKTEKQTRKEAQAVADAMEALAKGNATLEKQMDALRAAAAASGQACKMPLLKDYLESCKVNGGEQNRLNAQRACALFVQYMGADAMIRLDRVTREHAQGFIDAQAVRVRPSTVGRYVQSISAAFNAAIDGGLLTRNPWRGCKLPKARGEDKPRREAFTAEETAFILQKLPQAWKDLVLLCVGSGGQRIGDCACMRWSSVDFTAGVIRLETGKTGEVIENPLVEPLRSRLLELWREREQDEPYILPMMARRYGRSKGILSTEFTAMMEAWGLSQRIASPKGGDRRSVSTKSFHALRRAVVTMIRDGAGADMSRAIVGHKSEAVEQNHYYKANMNKKRAVLGETLAAMTGTQAAPAGGAENQKEA